MSLSPIGSAVFELLSRKHTYRQTDIHHITLEYRYKIICITSTKKSNFVLDKYSF